METKRLGAGIARRSDTRGQLYHAGFAYMVPGYELAAPYIDTCGHCEPLAGSGIR